MSRSRGNMDLFKPAWMGKNEAKALRALDKVSDDATLFTIATECPHRSVQLRAVSKFRNRDARLDVARTSRHVDPEVRKAALAGATEQELCAVAKCGGGIAIEGIRLEAVRMMSDEALLAEVAATVHNEARQDASVRAAAFAKVNDRELLLGLMDQYRDIYLGNVLRGPFDGSGDAVIREAVEDAYNRMERPPFEWSMLVQNEKASENIMLDLDEMSLPEDRDCILAILATTTFGKPLKQKAARLLPDDDPALDDLCCPYCGTIGSVEKHGGWSEYWDNYIYWAECKACKHRDSGDASEAHDFSVTLRELRDMQ